MPVEILAAGTNAANSASVTVTAAAPVTVSLKGTSGVPVFTSPQSTVPAIFIQSQDDTGAWVATGEQLSAQTPCLLLNRPGIYRVRRVAIDQPIGVFRSDP